ncbi:MAG TPA: MIP/aquaporin family protein [Hyphomicrobium sp.]|nr:MIP/aquaporin family protein [Hyphomicrobium sp.]HEX2840534.1 MIP/aquaporin family protein [Hyphomicrobium sp.]
MGSKLAQALSAEALGTGFLLAAVVGSGVMAGRLSGGNEALALLGNTLPTGAILIVLITMLAPFSGAHFNPAVTLVFALKRDLAPGVAAGYVLAQIAGAFVGVLAAHAMFDLPLLQMSAKVRAGSAFAFSEWVAAFGLMLTILLTLRARPEAVATSVGLYIVAAYWFTASTSFANPAVTLARAFSDTFAGIRLVDVPLFVFAQCAGVICALAVAVFLSQSEPQPAEQPLQSSESRP